MNLAMVFTACTSFYVLSSISRLQRYKLHATGIEWNLLYRTLQSDGCCMSVV